MSKKLRFIIDTSNLKEKKNIRDCKIKNLNFKDAELYPNIYIPNKGDFINFNGENFEVIRKIVYIEECNIDIILKNNIVEEVEYEGDRTAYAEISFI